MTLESVMDAEVASFRQPLVQFLDALELTVSDVQIEQLLAYLSLFKKWNKAYNLSAIREPQDMLIKHIFDSLVIARTFIQQPDFERFIDVGTGGGLPGIPMAILFPHKHFTLLDSAGKKMRFLFQVCQSLSLDHVTLENRRVESFHPDRLFDVVLSRAFASLEDMTLWCQHLLHQQGQFWAMKGVYPETEIATISERFIIKEVQRLRVPGLEGERCLLTIEAKKD